ncbi:MAG: hypothetical protein R3F43_32090 [bacterium]
MRRAARRASGPRPPADGAPLRPLSPAAEARVQAADAGQLDAWLDAILVAPSLEALLDVTP